MRRRRQQEALNQLVDYLRLLDVAHVPSISDDFELCELDRFAHAQAENRRMSPGVGSRFADSRCPSAIELLLLPRVASREVVEPRKHPAEQAQAGLLAPAVGIARACVDAGGLLRPGDQGQDQVADREGERQPLHPIKLALSAVVDGRPGSP